jgi:hypothetical protein
LVLIRSDTNVTPDPSVVINTAQLVRCLNTTILAAEVIAPDTQDPELIAIAIIGTPKGKLQVAGELARAIDGATVHPAARLAVAQLVTSQSEQFVDPEFEVLIRFAKLFIRQFRNIAEWVMSQPPTLARLLSQRSHGPDSEDTQILAAFAVLRRASGFDHDIADAARRVISLRTAPLPTNR